jgi:hypothetical protein
MSDGCPELVWGNSAEYFKENHTNLIIRFVDAHLDRDVVRLGGADQRHVALGSIATGAVVLEPIVAAAVAGDAVRRQRRHERVVRRLHGAKDGCTRAKVQRGARGQGERAGVEHPGRKSDVRGAAGAVAPAGVDAVLEAGRLDLRGIRALVRAVALLDDVTGAGPDGSDRGDDEQQPQRPHRHRSTGHRALAPHAHGGSGSAAAATATQYPGKM